MGTHPTRAPRRRTVLLTVLFVATTFALDAAPVRLPAPLDAALGPTPVQAAYCASNAAFSGRLTASSASTTALTRVTSPTVFGYISNVQTTWSCTLYYRYSGITWNTSPTLGTFAWGNLINSNSVSCNFVVGSTDYIKANGTSDCPDTDAEYALSASLGSEGVYQNDLAHDSTGDFSFVQTDCVSYYGANPLKTGVSYATSNTANRPNGSNGSNCDPIDTDSTNTAQTITYDQTVPTVAVTAPSGSATSGTSSTAYTVTFNPSDNVAGFGGSYLWSLQRQVATLTSPGVCGTFANDGAAGNLASGTLQGSQTNAQTLVATNCYRWILAAEDQNGNGPVSTTSGAVIVDLVDPVPLVTTPALGTTTTQNTQAYSVAWTETEAHSGVAGRSLQRQRVAATSSACPGTLSNDGAAATTASPSSQTLTTGYCYQWIETLTDGAGRTGAATSGTVYVCTTCPMADFSTPNEGTTTMQTATTSSVAWSESAGSGTLTGRSLQRQKGSIVTPSTCAGVPWANDGAAVSTVSPVSATGLTDGKCYRWVQTLTNSGGTSGASTSGSVLVDTTAPSGAITAPAANQPLAGDVTISGSATDTGSFKEYQLEYGVGTTPAAWTTIGAIGTTQVPPTGTLGTWSSGSLSGVYTLRLTVRENAGAAASVTSRTVVLENAGRGDEGFLSRVPFELGGGYTLDVGVHNGETRLSRQLFSIPSFGPAGAVDLVYSSLEPGTTGRFGVGWTSNLTQYLTFDATDIVVWHRADGGRVPFGKVGGAWTALAGQHESLAVGGGEYSITSTDQGKVVFADAAGAGRLKRIEDRFGKRLTLVWSTNSATATDASARVTNLAINAADNRITGVTDSAGRAWAFGYSGTGSNSDLTSITDPASKVTTLAYDPSHRLISVARTRSRVAGAPETINWTVGYTAGKATGVTDPVSATVANTFTYTGDSTTVGLLKEAAGPVRNSSTYAFDALGRVTTAADPEGFVTTSAYDTDSNLVSQANPIGTGTATASSTYAYDPKGNVLTEIAPVDGALTVTTASSYNATNDVLTRSEADSDPALKLVTKYSYDGPGHLLGVDVNCTTTGTTPPSTASTCTGAGTADAATNLSTTYTYTSLNQLQDETDPLGRVTRHTYDANGNETSVIANYMSGQSATNERNVTSGEAYAANQAGNAGLPTSTTDPLGRLTTLTYDALGRVLTEVQPGDGSIPVLTRTTTYDEFGNALTETEGWTPLGGGSPVTRTTSHVYDLANRETTTTDPALVATTTGYDAAGNAISGTAAGVTTARTFDGLGRVLSETTDNGTATHTYDAQGNELTSSNAEGEATATTYAVSGWVLATTTDPGGLDLEVAHTYDALGRELSVTDQHAVGQPPLSTTTNTYDRSGRQLTTSTAGATATTVYDRAGNATAVKAPEGAVAATLVDPLDRPVKAIANCTNSGTTQPAAGATCAGTGTADASTNITSETFYDATGATVAVTDPSGVATRTLVNARGLAVTTIADCTDDGTSPPATSNPAGCTGDPTPPLGTNSKTTLSYDGGGAVIQTITAVGTGVAEATTETAYDAAGRVQAVKDPRGTISRSLYDPATGQQTKTVVNCTSSGTTIPTDWVNCSGAGTADGTFNLATVTAYDANGNVTSVTAPNGRLTTSTYDDTGRLTERIDNDVASPTLPSEDVTTAYLYDDAGRQAAVIAPSPTGPLPITTRFVYDTDGTLVREIRNCTNTGLTLDPALEDPAACAATGTKNADTNVSTDYGYDAKGRRISVTSPGPAATSGTDTAAVTTQSAFDLDDRLCRVVENTTGGTNLQTLADPCSTATQGLGTTTQNLSTRYTYGPSGMLASMIDALGHTTTYAYDERGQLVATTDALNKTIAWAYDSLGRRIRQENRSDPPFTNSVVWTYDGAGRIQTRVADLLTTSYTYDDNGNKLTVSDGTFTISSTYDRLNRVLTVDDEDAGTTADTSYTYSLTNPSWTDPTGTYAATLDRFDRQTVLNDPANATNFTTSYGATGQPATEVGPNGNSTAFVYDRLGQLTSKDTTAGATNRALYDWTYNRAGQILTEASTISADPANGTITYSYDPLARLTGSTLSATTTTYGWDSVPNRTSVKVGAASAATTSFDAADRPTSGTNPSAAYTSDADGRLTARPSQTMTWDHLGRLTAVKNAAGTVTLAAYTYDPLDRLRMVDYGAGVRTRFRYVGLTTNGAQLINDAAGTVSLNIGNDWSGERLLDWTGAGSNIRIYGSNAHHDTTWLATSTGSVSQSLRYDPWGTPRSTVPGGYSPFRFQGSFYDATTDLAWVVTRWYAPSLGRFISEDSLLGDQADPPSRHLYAYGGSEPVGRWDPDGRYWKVIGQGETLASIAIRRLGAYGRWPALWNANRGSLPFNPSPSATLRRGSKIWIPTGWFTARADRLRFFRVDEVPWRFDLNFRLSYDVNLHGFGRRRLRQAQETSGVGGSRLLFNFTRAQLYAKTDQTAGYRPRSPSPSGWRTIWSRVSSQNVIASRSIGNGTNVFQESWLPGVFIVEGGDHPWYCFGNPCTRGEYIFLNTQRRQDSYYKTLLSHEYIHVLQFEGRGAEFASAYLPWLILNRFDAGPSHPEEAPAYLWEAWIGNFRAYGEPYPWIVWRRPPAWVF